MKARQNIAKISRRVAICLNYFKLPNVHSAAIRYRNKDVSNARLLPCENEKEQRSGIHGFSVVTFSSKPYPSSASRHSGFSEAELSHLNQL